MIKAVIFDLDGVLYDEKDFVMSGFNAVAKYLASKHGWSSSEIFEILKKDFEQGLRVKNFDVLLSKMRLKNEKISKLVAIYRRHSAHISLHHDARIILAKLKGACKLAIITDGLKETQEKKILALGLKRYLDVITINERKSSWKPNTKSFKATLEKLQVKPREAVYIGDNPSKDFIGCRKIRVHTVRIRRDKGEYNDLLLDEQHEADYTIPSLLDLEETLNQLNKKSPKSLSKISDE